MPSKDKYTDPKLRDEVKEELHKSDKGGAPGQWSARKAQMMASEYKKRGGDYNTDKSEKDESQKNLENWGKEDWQTKEGSGNAKQKDGSQKRYLPKKAWDNMSEKEKKETDDKKQTESKKGKQHVENTEKAKNSRKKAAHKEEEEEEEEEEGEEDVEQSDSDQDEENDEEFQPDERGEKEEKDEENEVEQSDSDQDEEDDEEFQPEEENDEDDDKENDDGSQQNDSNNEEDQNAKRGQKRGRSTQEESSSKKQKSNSGESASKKTTVGSKHMDAKEPGKRGSADRLPKKNQKVHWKAMPGYVAGKLVEVLTKDKQVDGKSYKASEKDPRLVLKSDSSGKTCVHKPEACFYD